MNSFATTTSRRPNDPLGEDIRRRMQIGLVLTGVLVLGLGGWAASTPLSGAVIASGAVVVESSLKKVQHPTGGVLGAILVRNGQAVEAGEVLLRLDDTQTRASLGVIQSQITQFEGRKARLEAERDLADEIRFPRTLALDSPEVSEIVEGERRLFELRRTARIAQKQQLAERVTQLREEIRGLSGQKSAKGSELALVSTELARVTDMHRRDLTPVTRLTASQRDVARIQGEHEQLAAQIARAQGQISETELQISSIDHTMRSEATRELRDLEARLAELMERRVAALDTLRRVEIRSPASGYVHDLNIATVGGVVSPGEVLMSIVPGDDPLVIEAKVNAAEIDQVVMNKSTLVRFMASNQGITPEMMGTVTRIGRELTKEPQTNLSYFLVRIAVSDGEIGKFPSFKPLPGMPVETYIETYQRTALTFFVKPVTDFLARVGRSG